MFSAHALREWVWPLAHINVTTFTRSAQKVPACIVWLYYACSYTVAFSPSVINSSFAVLHTEKCTHSVHQCTLELDSVDLVCVVAQSYSHSQYKEYCHRAT